MNRNYQPRRAGQLFDSLLALSISVASISVLVAGFVAPAVGLA